MSLDTLAIPLPPPFPPVAIGDTEQYVKITKNIAKNLIFFL